MEKITLNEYLYNLTDIIDLLSEDFRSNSDDEVEGYYYEDLDADSGLLLAEDRLSEMVDSLIITIEQKNRIKDLGYALRDIFDSGLPRNAHTIRNSDEWKKVFELSKEVESILDDARNRILL